jgi:hypothetical protein
VDDYFFVFVTHKTKPNGWHEASVYADGGDDFLRQLSQTLGFDVHCGLVNSTDYKSRVMWPQEIAGETLFDFVPVESNTWREKIRHKLIPEYFFVYTDVVKNHLATDQRAGA